MNNSSKKIALFDLDGTLINAHLWLGIVKHHFKTKENLFPTFWYLLSHMALLPLWKIHFLSTERYYQSWGQDLSTVIRGTNTERAKEIFNWLVDQYLLPTSKKNVLERLKKHQKEGYLTILTSASFQNLIEIIAQRLKIDFAVGTELEVVNGKFSGGIIPPFCFGKGKVERLENFLSEKNLKINFQESFAYSDGIFDLPMLELVGNPVVVEPDKKLLEIAKDKGWQII